MRSIGIFEHTEGSEAYRELGNGVLSMGLEKAMWWDLVVSNEENIERYMQSAGAQPQNCRI